MNFHANKSSLLSNKDQRIHTDPKSNELSSTGSTSPFYNPNTTTDSCYHGDIASRSQYSPNSWYPTNSFVRYNEKCDSFQRNIHSNLSSPISTNSTSMYGDAELLVGAAKTNMAVDLDNEVTSPTADPINLDSDEDDSLESIAKKKRKRDKSSKKEHNRAKKPRRLPKLPENFEDEEGKEDGLTIARYVLGEAKTHGWDKLQNKTDRHKWVATMLPHWKTSFLLGYNPIGHALFDKYLGAFKARVKKEYWGRRHSAGSDESGEEMHKAISLCLEWIDYNESTDALTSSAKKKKITATEKAFLCPEAPLGDNNNAPIRSSVQSKNVKAGLVKHTYSKEELMEHGDATALASGASGFSVTRISAKNKKGGNKRARRSFLDDAVEELGLGSESTKQEDVDIRELVDLLKPNNPKNDDKPSPVEDSKVVIRLMRAGSDKSLDFVFQKSSNCKVQTIITEASKHSCDFFNFSIAEKEAVKEKRGSMMLSIDGVSEYSYSLLKEEEYGIIDLVGIAKGNKNGNGNIVVEITSRIEMVEDDVSFLL